MRSRPWVASLVVLVAAVAIGCGGGRQDQPPAASNEMPGDPSTDFDQDGLADVDENNLYHTSAETKDTDGDGYSDYQEIFDLGYNPSNPTNFNPLVADVPQIRIELTTAPEVTVEYSRSTGSAETEEIGRTITVGTSTMRSRSEEVSWSVTAGFQTGIQAGFSASATAGGSLNWTSQESQENQRALSDIRSTSQNSELREEGGRAKVGVAITNVGHIPFTIQNVTLTAFRLDGTHANPIAQLEAQSERSFFDMGTWAPGERVELAFSAQRLTLADVEQLLTGDLLVQVSKYELKDENGQSFAHRLGPIEAACARVAIDYGGKAPAESYLVSTRTAPDERGVRLDAVLGVLGIPYETGRVAWTHRKRTPEGRLMTGDGATETSQTRKGLLTLRDVRTDPQQGGRWVVVHTTPEAPSGSVTSRHDLLEEDYELADVALKPRDTVELSYVRDSDQDGLDTSAEASCGTDPWQADTDKDGVADGDEIREGTDPLRDDSRPWPELEFVKLERAGKQVVLNIGVPDSRDSRVERLRIEWGDGSLADEIIEPRGTITSSHYYAAVGSYRIVVTPYAGPRSPCEPYEIEASMVPALVLDMTMQFGTKGPDRLHGVAVDPQGSIYLAGDVEDRTPLAMEPGRVFLVKCSAGGEREWTVQFGDAYELPGCLALDREGNVHLAAYDSRPEPEQPASLREYSPTRILVRPPLDPFEGRDKSPVRGLLAGDHGITYFVAQGRSETGSRKPDLRKISIRAESGKNEAGEPESSAQESQPRNIHRGCEPFEDPESLVRKNPITRVAVCYGQYIHGIQLTYGLEAGSLHGYQSVACTRKDWVVPDLERIVRVEGQVATNPSKFLYVSRLQFVTDRGTRSPLFGGAAGAPFTAADPNGLPLRTISGWANLRRHPSLNRAIAGLTFHFGGGVGWQARLPGDVSVEAIAAGASGGIYACGYRRPGRTTVREKLNDGSFVARYGRDGELDWMRWHGDNENDQSVAIAVDGRGSAYVVDLAAGRTPDTPNRGRFDVRLVKYDAEGKLLWMRQFGTRLFDVAFSVAVSPGVKPGGQSGDAQAVYVAGVSQGNLYDETADLVSDSRLNAFLVAFDSDGFRTFLEQFPLDAEVPEPTEITRKWWRKLPVTTYVTTDGQGNVYLAGGSERSLTPDYTNKGSADVYLMRFVPNPEYAR